jgi:hypothetical protein
VLTHQLQKQHQHSTTTNLQSTIPQQEIQQRDLRLNATRTTTTRTTRTRTTTSSISGIANTPKTTPRRRTHHQKQRTSLLRHQQLYNINKAEQA